MAIQFADVQLSTSLTKASWFNEYNAGDNFFSGSSSPISPSLSSYYEIPYDSYLGLDGYNDDYYALFDVFITPPSHYDTYGPLGHYANRNRYVLEIEASAGSNYLDSFDISLDYDANKWEVRDVGISDNFNLFNSVSFEDNYDGSIRVVGGSANELVETGNDDTSATTFQVLLEARIHDLSYFEYGGGSEITTFTTTVNSTDSVVNDGVEFYNATSNQFSDSYHIEYGYLGFDLHNGVDFATVKDDGSASLLVREGDTLESIGDIALSNIGNIGGSYTLDLSTYVGGASYQLTFNDDSALDDVYVLDRAWEQGIDWEGNGHSIIYGDIGSDYGYGNPYRKFSLTLDVTGQAGDVIDLSNSNVMVNHDYGGYESINLGETAKNLITFQADVSYDGRVSMMDLAHLNGGAVQGYDRAVDVDYSGALDIGDLAKMDEQWGMSLHENNIMNGDVFTGNNGSVFLSSQTFYGNDGYDVSTNDSSFIDQNLYENSPDSVDTLAPSGTAGYSENTTEESTQYVDPAIVYNDYT